MAPTEGASIIDLPLDYYHGSVNRSGSWLPPHPPHHNVGGDPPPNSVVLDTLVYLDDRTNDSTAEGFTSNGHAIYVTFWPAPPPLLSYFTVHLPGLLPQGSDTSLALMPRLLRTDGGLALLRVIIGPVHSNPEHNNYIIYRAGANTLEVLPTHPTHLFPDSSVGLLNCRDDGRFFVADLRSTYSRGHYALDLFDSRSGTWSTRSMHAESPQHCYFGSPTKVIAIGGNHGSIGWVDIWNGILICDLLPGRANMDGDVLRFISLPLILAPNKMVTGPSLCDRDVTVTNDGCIKYVEVWARPVPGSQNAITYISQDWGVAIVTWLETEKNWRIDRTIKASEIVVDKNHPQLLPYHLTATRKSPILRLLHAGHPVLSLHEDDVVYIMTKVDHRKPESWVLAVDMKSKTLKGVSDLSTRRSLSFSSMYFQSDISKHLPMIKKSEISKHLPKSIKSSNRQKGNGKRNAAKTSTGSVVVPVKQGSVANWPRVDADVMVAGRKRLVHGSKVEEQDELEVKVFDFSKVMSIDSVEMPVKQGDVETLANCPCMDADAMVKGCKHSVHRSVVEEQEEQEVMILDFRKAQISCS